MLRFHCPECGAEKEVAPRYGSEIASVYCLEHTGGVDAHRRPVYMTVVQAPLAMAQRKPALLRGAASLFRDRARLVDRTAA